MDQNISNSITFTKEGRKHRQKKQTKLNQLAIALFSFSQCIQRICISLHPCHNSRTKPNGKKRKKERTLFRTKNTIFCFLLSLYKTTNRRWSIYYKHKPHKREGKERVWGVVSVQLSNHIYRSNLHKFVPQSFNPPGAGEGKPHPFCPDILLHRPPDEKNKRRTKPALNCPMYVLLYTIFAI